MEQFEKVKGLGRGAQGVVILVRRKSDGNKFCIKKIPIEDQSPEDQKEVMNEIRVLAKLAHPNIVAYYGSFMENEDLNVVMEYADGGNLSQYINKQKEPLPESQVMMLFTQLLLCMDYLHNKKILHRDLKTKNVFITKKLIIKLGDFGLSRIMGSQTDFAQSAVGTPYYLSPELCESKPYNHKSDVWAIGCILYELATFKHAFDANNLPALVMNIVNGKFDVNPLQRYSPGVSELVRAMLQKNPDNRPDIPLLLEHPLVQEYREAAENACTGCDLDGSMAPNKPFFIQGAVETVVTQAANGQQHATDAIMKEIQQEETFKGFVQKLQKALHIQDRIMSRVPYFKTFVAKDLVNYICDHIGIRSRTEAAAAAQSWMDAGVFYHVSRGDKFEDGEGLYRFKEDEAGSILNMKSKWSGSERPAVQVQADVTAKLTQMIDKHTSGQFKQVDYGSLAVSEEFMDFQASTTELQKTDLATISFNIKIAFYINLYNSLVLHGFTVLGPPSTMHQRIYFYNHTCYHLGGFNFSLNDIEHGLLRGNQKPHNSYCRVFHPNDQRMRCSVLVWDPRIHFALVRGTKSCPVLRVYDPENLDPMLDEAAVDFCTRHVSVRQLAMDDSAFETNSWSVGQLKEYLTVNNVDLRSFSEKSELAAAAKAVMSDSFIAGNGERAEVQDSWCASTTLHAYGEPDGRKTLRKPGRASYGVSLPAIFNWYKSDFGQTDENLLLWVKERMPSDKAQAIDKAIERDNFIIEYLPFDWSLNRI